MIKSTKGSVRSNIREKYLRFSIHEQGSLNQVFVRGNLIKSMITW